MSLLMRYILAECIDENFNNEAEVYTHVQESRNILIFGVRKCQPK